MTDIQMNKIHTHHTRAALDWLQSILFERFGHVFTMSQSMGYTNLSIPFSRSAIRIASNLRTFIRTDSDLPFTQWDGANEGWDTPLDRPLPAPGSASLRSPLIEKDKQGVTIHYDILGLAYWMLSRQEEVGRSDLDLHGRFPATASHAYKHGYLERPVVDEWLDILGQVIKRLWPSLKQLEHRFSIQVSHDVDGVGVYSFSSGMQLVRKMAGDVLKRHDIIQALKTPRLWWESRERLHPDDPYNTFDWIMDASESHGLVSAFYFMCGRTDLTKDARYEVEHPSIRDLMRRIHARGHNIGLHPSYNAYRYPHVIAAEAARLKRLCQEEKIEQYAWGGRMHYLRWETPTTLHGWEQAGMNYDSSLSYADHPGFRCGTCFEYPAFDPVIGQALNLRIRPLIAMECTVIASRYLNLGTGAAARAKFVQLKDACHAVKGCFTLLWHNSHLNSQQERDLYIDLLS